MKMLSEVSAAPVHRDADPGVFQRGGPGRSGELRSLIRIHDLWRAVFGDCLLQSLDAKVGMHRIAEPPAQHLPGCPVHNRHQIQEAILDWHEGDVGAPDLVGAVDHHLPQQIRIDRMLWVWLAGSGAFIDCLQAHLCHQTSHAVASHDDALPAQICRELA